MRAYWPPTGTKRLRSETDTARGWRAHAGFVLSSAPHPGRQPASGDPAGEGPGGPRRPMPAPRPDDRRCRGRGRGGRRSAGRRAGPACPRAAPGAVGPVVMAVWWQITGSNTVIHYLRALAAARGGAGHRRRPAGRRRHRREHRRDDDRREPVARPHRSPPAADRDRRDGPWDGRHRAGVRRRGSAAPSLVCWSTPAPSPSVSAGVLAVPPKVRTGQVGRRHRRNPTPRRATGGPLKDNWGTSRAYPPTFSPVRQRRQGWRDGRPEHDPPRRGHPRNGRVCGEKGRIRAGRDGLL